MNEISSLISNALADQEYSSYSEFEADFLAINKDQPLQTVLCTALKSTSIGQAFSIGYRCALQALVPQLNQHEWAAFCVAEKSGSHPKKLTTTVSSEGILNGDKSFVFMADRARQIVVISVDEKTLGQSAQGQPKLLASLLQIPNDHAAISPLPKMVMIPDVPHGKLLLKGAHSTLLEGDGYLDYSKCFRWLEDRYLLMGFTALILSKVKRYNLDDELIDECMLIIGALFSLRDKEDAWGTLMLNGAYLKFQQLLKGFEKQFEYLPKDFSERWLIDKKVFALTEEVRRIKRAKAVAHLK